MARQEAPREDLLRDATALPERAELQLSGFSEPVVVGFRRDGAASFFFGETCVLHFNAARQLRRAYFEGLLYKAEAGKLVSLQRQRAQHAVVLQRHELDAAETTELLALAGSRLGCLTRELQAGTCAVLRQVPADGELATRIIRWLASLSAPITVANRPHVS